MQPAGLGRLDRVQRQFQFAAVLPLLLRDLGLLTSLGRLGPGLRQKESKIHQRCFFAQPQTSKNAHLTILLLAKPAALHDCDRFLEHGRFGTALLRADLKNFARFFLRLDNQPAFLNGMYHWSLTIDMLTGLHGQNGRNGMHMIRRADYHCINAFLVQ